MVTPSDITGTLVPSKARPSYQRSRGVGFLFTFGGVAVHDLRGILPSRFFTCADAANRYVGTILF